MLKGANGAIGLLISGVKAEMKGAKSLVSEHRSRSQGSTTLTRGAFSRELWGVHAPRVLFSAPRQKPSHHVAITSTTKKSLHFVLRKSRSPRRRTEHARRVRSPIRRQAARSAFTEHGSTI